MISALNVANNILVRAFEENINVTPMKLQKLVYFIYRDYLRETQKPLFGERFETWAYGPVVPSIYQYFKKYGARAIKEYFTENNGKIRIVDEDESPIFKQVLDNIWNMYKTCSGPELSDITHKKDSAWTKAYKRKSYYLSDEDIESEVIDFA